MSYDHTISYAYPQCLFISDDIVSLRTCGANKHYAQGPARKHTSFTAITENDDFFHNWELYNTLCTRSTRTGGVQSANYSQSSLHCPSRKASRRKRIWSTQEASNLLLLASKISPAAEKRRSTAVDVAGAVRYLNMSFNANLTTIYCGYQGWLPHPAP